MDEKFKDKLVLFQGVITNTQNSCMYFLLAPEVLILLPLTICIRCTDTPFRRSFIKCNVGIRIAFYGKVSKVSSVIYVDYYNSNPNSSDFYTFEDFNFYLVTKINNYATKRINEKYYGKLIKLQGGISSNTPKEKLYYNYIDIPFKFDFLQNNIFSEQSEKLSFIIEENGTNYYELCFWFEEIKRKEKNENENFKVFVKFLYWSCL